MVALRSVVAATDLSAPARRAADRAAMLAASASASLTLIHVVSGSALDELRRWLDRNGLTEQSILDEVWQRTRNLASELAAQYRIDVDHCVVRGSGVDGIVRIAQDRGADLVVTGTLGSGSVRNRLVGATAERVARKSSQPVLMVRQAPREPYRRVLVPVDFSRYSYPSVALAAAVAPDAQLVLLHAIAMPLEGSLPLAAIAPEMVHDYQAVARDEAMRLLGELAARAGLEGDRWTPLVQHDGSAWMQIVQQEQEQDCDLVVIGKRGRGAVEELLLGGTTNRIIGESSADVLVSTRTDP